MAVLAAVYGIVSGNGIWYPMNLLVAGLFPAMARRPPAQIGTFNLQALLVAVPIHLMISLLVGLLYGAMLPMLPRRPILFGGFVAPLLWSVSDLWRSRVHQSGDEPAHRLGSGLCFSNRIRNCRGHRCRGSGAHPHAAACTADGSMGIEAPGLMEEHQEESKR